MHRHIPNLFLAATLILAGIAGLAQAHEYKAGALTIVHPWVRATPKGAQVAGGFLTITNTGSAPDRLLGAAMTCGARAEVHATSTEGGIARMRPVEGGLEIKPGETVKLAPGGYHLMVTDLKGSFVDGELVEGTLQFEKAGSVSVDFEVQAVGATASPDHTPRH